MHSHTSDNADFTNDAQAKLGEGDQFQNPYQLNTEYQSLIAKVAHGLMP